MSVQPIVLNVVSVFVVGYIASSLGQDDYGKFVLAFSMIAMFLPICSFGLRAVAVRDMAANRDNARVLVGKYFVLGLLLSFASFVLLVIVVNSLQYPAITKLVIYIAGLNLFLRTIGSTFFDIFQAFEKMKYIAYGNMISGVLLTLFSVIVIYFGYRLIGITLVYVGGSVALVVAMAIFYRIHFRFLKLSIDVPFWRERLRQGFPFFVTAMLWMVNMRICVVLLSKMTDDTFVGVYGASFNIVSRLYIFPDSIGTAIFPTIAFLYASKNMAELGSLSEKFFRYTMIMGLPFSLGVALLSPRIIDLIYGTQYASSAASLSILAAGIPFLFMIGLFAFALGAVHRQGQVVKANLIATALNLAITVLLIPPFRELGAAAGYAASQLITSALLFYYFRRFLAFRLDPGGIAKIILANAVMSAAVYVVKDMNLLVAVFAPAGLYLGLIVALRVVTAEDLALIKDALFKKEITVSDPSAGKTASQ